MSEEKQNPIQHAIDSRPQTAPMIDPFDEFVLHSPLLGKFAEAFSQLQSELPTIKKNKTGKIKGVTKGGVPYEYEYKYADLEDVVAAYRPLLGKYGFMVTQHKKPIDKKGYWMVTRVTHTSEQFIQSFYPMKGPESLGQQQHGSETTYGRRYEISNLFNVVAEEDDDGKTGDAPKNQQDVRQRAQGAVQAHSKNAAAPAQVRPNNPTGAVRPSTPSAPPPSTEPDFIDDGPVEGNTPIEGVRFLSGPFKDRTLKEAWAARVRAIPHYHGLKDKAKAGGTLTPKEIAFMTYGLDNKFVMD